MKDYIFTALFLLALAGSAGGQTDSLRIFWDQNSESDIFSYRLQRAVNSLTTFQQIEIVNHPQTSMVDRDVSPGNLYVYQVAAQDENGNLSSYSTSVLAGIPLIDWNVATISAGSDTTIDHTSFLSDPHGDVADLVLEITQETNLSVTVNQDNIVLSPSPSDFEGFASFTIRAEDTAGFYDLKNLTVEFGSSSSGGQNVNLAVTVSGAGSVITDPGGSVHPQGTEISMTAVPDPNWQFSGWEGDYTGIDNPLTVTMDVNKSYTAVFVENESPAPGVLHVQTLSGSSARSKNVSTDNALIAVDGNLYLAAIIINGGTTVQSLSGLGLDWLPVRSSCSGAEETRVELWMALGAPTEDAVVTAQLSASPRNAVISVSSYSGADPVDPIGAVLTTNTNGINGGCSGGTTSSDYTFELPAATDGACVFSIVGYQNQKHTPDPALIQRAEVVTGGGKNAVGLTVQDQTVPEAAMVQVQGSFNRAVNWGVLGLEIRAAGGENNNFNPTPNSQLADGNEIIVFPNPIKLNAGHDRMIFANLPEESRSISLFSLLGEELHEEEIPFFASREYHINVGQTSFDVPNGTYIYMVKNEGNQPIKTGKIVILR